MAAYTPYLVAGMKTGLELDLEPWLLPSDAYSELNNAFIRDGVLQKRRGYIEYADTGAGYPIMGIMDFIESDGSKTLLVADTKRLYEYSGGVLIDLDGADIWTGDATNFVSWVNYLGKIYMANGHDRLRYFDGSTAGYVNVDIDGDSNNDLTACWFTLVHKERVLLFHTTESGTAYHQRVRWCKAGDPSDWETSSGGGYIDVPVGEWIRGAGYLGSDIIIWCDNSAWILRYTGDSSAPFVLERISTEYGAIAGQSIIEIRNKSFALGKYGMVQSDGSGVVRIDQKIPDMAIDWAASYLDKCFGFVAEELRQAWLLYPSMGETSPDKALVWDYETGAWATIDMPMTCLGATTQSETLTWATMPGTWANANRAWDESSSQAGYSVMLGGDSSGKIYKLNEGAADISSDISLSIMTGRWNPYKSNGVKARLGYIDFLIESISGVTVTLNFYMDFDTVSYLTETIDFNQDGEKAWVRIFVNNTAASHRFSISNTGAGQVKIHAITPWFKPAGRIANG